MNRALALLALLAIAPASLAATPGTPVVAGPDAEHRGYATGTVVVPAGGDLTFVNADLMRHNVVADESFGDDFHPWCVDYPLGACPRFRSDYALLGESVPVLGMDQVFEFESYPFRCEIHPTMQGTLVVLPAA